MKCEICGKDYDNLGAHMYQKHRDTSDAPQIIVDDITEKPLSELILDIKDLLRKYRSDITIRTIEKGGKMSEIEITARIQL